jgi:hypothetical protein
MFDGWSAVRPLVKVEGSALVPEWVIGTEIGAHVAPDEAELRGSAFPTKVGNKGELHSNERTVKLKALIGALAGAGIGSAVWFWLATQGILRETSWIPILIGTLTGGGAWLFAKPMAHAWQRGAVVAAIALVATYFTHQGTSSALEHGFEGVSLNMSEIFFPDSPVSEPSQQPYTAPGGWKPPPRLAPSVSPEKPREAPAVAGNPEPERNEAPSLQPDPPVGSETASQEAPVVADNPASERNEVPSLRSDSAVATDGPLLEIYEQAKQQQLTSPVRTEPNPPLADQGTLVALSYAFGMLLAYVLGRGPELRVETQQAATPTA